MRILIAEDDQVLADGLLRTLRKVGYAVDAVGSGSEADAALADHEFDLVILDLGLPKLHGLEVLRKMRARGTTTPVLILTAADSVEQRVKGLDLGADDYMAKPFRFEELLARVRLRLRAPQGAGEVTSLTHGVLQLDLRTRRMRVGDHEVELSAREFALAETFLRHPGHVLTREQLLSEVWGYDFDPGSNVVDVYVRYLRAKFGAEHIETVRGMGYRLR